MADGRCALWLSAMGAPASNGETMCQRFDTMLHVFFGENLPSNEENLPSNVHVIFGENVPSNVFLPTKIEPQFECSVVPWSGRAHNLHHG